MSATDGVGLKTTSTLPIELLDVQTPPVAAYSFDEGAGTVAHDISGNLHEGTLSAEGVSWAPGRYGTALKFDGAKGCVSIPDSSALQLREEFTLESWVKPEGEMLHYPAIYKESSEGFPSYDLGIGFNTAAKPEGQLGKEGKAHQDLTGSTSLEANVWSHLALTYDGVKLRLYLNGELVATKTVEKPVSATPGPLTIGCSALGGQHFKGRIDEVRIYNRALEAGEVAADRLAPIQTPQVAPVADWSFDENGGAATRDGILGGPEAAFSPEGLTWEPGRYGSALHFDGAKGCLTVPSSEALQLKEEFTLESWVKPEGELTHLPILYKAGEGFPAYDLGIGLTTSGRGEGQIGTLAKSHTDAQTPVAMEAGVWQHLAVTFDGTKLRLYLNGALVTTKAVTETNSGVSGALTIGCSASQHFRGRIDEVRIYNRALEASEVAADREAPIQTLKAGPVASWSFDEGTGTAVHDAVAGGPEGTLSTEGTSWKPGKYGSSLQFDGSKGCFTVPSSEALQLKEEFTLEAWVRPEGELAHLPILYKEGGGFPAYDLGIGLSESGRGEGQIGTLAKSHTDIRTTAAMETGVWQHLAVTFDGARLRLYRDGTLVTTKPVSEANSGVPGALTIGCSSSYRFRGRIDEVRIYNRALEASEIASDRLAPIRTPQAAPVAALSFDEGQGTVVEDSTGGGHDGTLSTEGVSWAPGRYGNALKFDGSKGCVTVPDSPALRLNEEFTLAAWVRPEGELLHLPAITKQAEGFPAYSLGVGMTTVGRAEGQIGTESKSHIDAVSASSLEAGVWQHLALTYDGVKLRLYVNAELVATKAVEKANAGALGPLMIGCSATQHFRGRIDEVRVYNRALEAWEVTADLEAPVRTPKTGPVAAYPLDEGEGIIAHDVIGGGHDGTLSTEGVSWAPGRYGNALKFDGSKGCVTVPDSPALRLNEEFTLAAWVRPEGELLHLPAITKQAEGFPAYSLGVGMTTVGRAEGQIGTESKSHIDAVSASSLEAGVWQHLALTYDGVKLRLYVNAELVATKAVEKANAGALGPLMIGCSATQHFRGRIDEVRVYNRALPVGELVNARLPLPTPVTAEAYGVEPTEAVFAATINPEGEETTYRFEYGTSTAYGQTYPEPTEEPEEGVVGEEPQEVEQAIDGLAPETIYHYRVVAMNGRGTTVGKDRTLLTLKPKTPTEKLKEEREQLPASKSWRGFIGMNWSGDPQKTYIETDQINLVQESGSRLFRVPIGRAEVGGSDDNIFEHAAKLHVSILPGITGFPWRKDNLLEALPAGSTHREEWIGELKGIVARYGKGGKFWDEHDVSKHPELPPSEQLDPSLAPEEWEIWNEENYYAQGVEELVKNPKTEKKEKKVRIDPEVYGEVLQISHDAITSMPGHGNDKIIFGGLLTVGKEGTKPHMRVGVFLRRATAGHAGAYQILSLHPYAFQGVKNGASPAEEKKTVQNIRRKVKLNISAAHAALRQVGGDEKKIWITELGWPVKDTVNGVKYAEEDGSHRLVPEKVQKELLNSTFTLIKEFSSANEESFNIGRLLWYNIQDKGNLNWDSHCGLVQNTQGVPGEEGAKREAFGALVKQSE